MIHLVTGGARSGKSSYAERSVTTFGQNICYIATAIAFDSGMRNRIAKHRQQRPANWQTVEQYAALADLIEANAGRYDAYLLDCVTIMVSNLMFDGGLDFEIASEAEIDGLEVKIGSQIEKLIDAVVALDENIVLVTNEIGYGIVPQNRMARYFRDIAGRVNQYIAGRADRVTLVVCGQPLEVKSQCEH